MTIEPYTAEHFRRLTGEEQVTSTAALNQISGPGFTLMDNGKVIAVGGVRVQGIGQAWCLLSPAILNERRKLIEISQDVLQRCMNDAQVYRVYAEASVDKPHFYELLGFRQQVKDQNENLVHNLWVR